MNKFELDASWIKTIRPGRNTNWNYDYKEYLFNENYTKAYSIRIPQGTVGIKAMLYSNDSGIIDEFTDVILTNGNTQTILFDMHKGYEQVLLWKIEKLEAENEKLKLELNSAKSKLDFIQSILDRRV